MNFTTFKFYNIFLILLRNMGDKSYAQRGTRMGMIIYTFMYISIVSFKIYKGEYILRPILIFQEGFSNKADLYDLSIILLFIVLTNWQYY